MKKRAFLLALPLLAFCLSTPLHADSGSLRIIKFEADWCGPCQKMKPIFSSVAGQYESGVTFESVDVDAKPSTADRYQVEVLPTVVAVKDGKVVGRATGFMNAMKLKAFINKHR
jgi:thioredoxin 1